MPFRRLARTRLLASLLPLACASMASAAPFETTYTGVISASTFPEIRNLERFTLTLVVDNGGTSATNQTWLGSDIRCGYWRMNNAGNVRMAHDTSPWGINGSLGQIETGPSGALVQMFSQLYVFPAVNVTTAGFTTVPISNVRWRADGFNTVFMLGPRMFSDASGGVQMAPAQWSAPVPSTLACDAALPAPAAGAAVAVPTLSGAGTALLTSLLGFWGFFAAGRRLKSPRR